jgi:hypothetical protein
VRAGVIVFNLSLTSPELRNNEGRFMKRGTAPRFSEEDTRPVETSGWRVIGLWAFYVLLSALTAALSAAIGTLPYWVWPAH